MNLKNIKISTQLKIGFTVILLLVVVLGAVSYLQTEKIHSQTETIYNHPLKVRRAIGSLSIDILQIRIQMSGLVHAKNEQEIAEIMDQVEILDANAQRQNDILYTSYLGPRSDGSALTLLGSSIGNGAPWRYV